MIQKKELFWLSGGYRKDLKEKGFFCPLGNRGKKEARHMIAYLQEHGEVRPDIVLCSSALRAKQMWDLIKDFIPTSPVSYHRFLYLASGHTVLEIISSVQDTINSVFVIGHIKAMNELSTFLQIDCLKPYTDISRDITKGTFLHIVFDDELSWRDIHSQKAHLKDVFYL